MILIHLFLSVSSSIGIVIFRLNIGQLCHFCIEKMIMILNFTKDYSSSAAMKTFFFVLNVNHFPVSYIKQHLQRRLRIACSHSTHTVKCKKHSCGCYVCFNGSRITTFPYKHMIFGGGFGIHVFAFDSFNFLMFVIISKGCCKNKALLF